MARERIVKCALWLKRENMHDILRYFMVCVEEEDKPAFDKTDLLSSRSSLPTSCSEDLADLCHLL